MFLGFFFVFVFNCIYGFYKLLIWFWMNEELRLNIWESYRLSGIDIGEMMLKKL